MVASAYLHPKEARVSLILSPLFFAINSGRKSAHPVTQMALKTQILVGFPMDFPIDFASHPATPRGCLGLLGLGSDGHLQHHL